MEILCTNDDGVLSPGLAAAVQAAREFGNVHVAAPSSQKTGAGRSLIGDRTRPFARAEILVGAEKLSAWHLDGTPALVVRHALSSVLRERKFDLAISGINYGENIGYDVSNSGTVGAAMECAVAGIPAIAISVQTELDGHRKYSEVDWSPTQSFLRTFIRRFIEKRRFSAFDVLKIDVPMDADEKTEWKVCRLLLKPYYLTKMSRESDDSVIADASLYVDPARYAPGTDAYTLAVERKVAVTPLVLDWTAGDGADFFT